MVKLQQGSVHYTELAVTGTIAYFNGSDKKYGKSKPRTQTDQMNRASLISTQLRRLPGAEDQPLAGPNL